MGMTIDEAIKRIGDIRKNYDRWSGLGLTPNEAETFKLIVDTMRKYQKIEQILKDIPYGGDATVRRIQEVVEDGNGVI